MGWFSSFLCRKTLTGEGSCSTLLTSSSTIPLWSCSKGSTHIPCWFLDHFTECDDDIPLSHRSFQLWPWTLNSFLLLKKLCRDKKFSCLARVSLWTRFLGKRCGYTEALQIGGFLEIAGNTLITFWCLTVFSECWDWARGIFTAVWSSLPFSGHSPAHQCPSCQEGPKTAPRIWGGHCPASPFHSKGNSKLGFSSFLKWFEWFWSQANQKCVRNIRILLILEISKLELGHSLRKSLKTPTHQAPI